MMLTLIFLKMFTIKSKMYYSPPRIKQLKMCVVIEKFVVFAKSVINGPAKTISIMMSFDSR